jgi:GntR family transcriptional regulator/MocR family aminotransferase
MRKPRGVLLPLVAGRRLRRADIYGALRAAVLNGALTPGERLPSTRQAALDYGVSRGMMEEVFAQLTEERLFVRAIGRGTFIAKGVSRLKAPPAPEGSPQLVRAPSHRGQVLAAMAACREPAIRRPFNAGMADTSQFPWKLWQQIESRAAKILGKDGLTFADPRGLPELKAALARYLAQFRGVLCQPEQVVIFNSAQQALHSLALSLLNAGDEVWIEDPCYLGARTAFQLAGAVIAPVPVDGEGLRVDIGVRSSPHARIAYVTPSHQYPTGVSLNLERRLAMIEWAARNDAWIIEDDYDSEFHYAGQPSKPIYTLDRGRRVIYVGTLTKSMFASLRLAFAVMPSEIVEPLASVRTQLDGFTPAGRQMAASLFMEEGHFSSHLRRMRSLYLGKRASLVRGLEGLVARGWRWPDHPAGTHLLVTHENGEYARGVAAASSLDLTFLHSYRIRKSGDDGLLLRFAALDPASLGSGASALVAAAKKVRA